MSPFMLTDHSGRRVQGALVVAVVAAALLSGCGSRRSDEDVATAMARLANTEAATPGPAGGNAATGLGAGSTTDPGANTDGATGAGGPTGAAGAAAGAGGGSTAAGGAGPGGSGGATSGAAGSAGAGSAGAAKGPAAKPGAGGSAAAKPTPGAPAAPTPGGAPTPATGAPIKLGSVGVHSGVAGAVFQGTLQALRVWVRWTNSRGGIKGHPVEITFVDDGGDPARHRAAIQKLVEETKVIAFVGNLEVLTGRGSVGYHQQVRVPVLGSDTGSPHYYESTMHFPEASNGSPHFLADMGAAVQQAKTLGFTKFATLTCTEATSCGDASQLWQQRQKEFGITIGFNGRASIAQPDFTTECLQARNSGAQVFLMVMDTPSVSRVAQACLRQNFKPVYASSTTTVAAADDPNLDGFIFGSPTYPWILSDTPASAEFAQAFKTYGEVSKGSTSALGWAAAKMLERALANTQNPQPTNEDVLRGLWSFKNETLGGLSSPLTFTEGQPPPKTACWHLMVVKNKAWTAPTGGKLSCHNF